MPSNPILPLPIFWRERINNLPKKNERRDESMDDNAVIFIGDKPVMNYVLAVMTQFNRPISSATLKARGRAISRAVDTAEIIRNRFMPNLIVKNITIGTEVIQSEDSKAVNVSFIEIMLSKSES
jgi:DNA-binding protein